MAQTELKIVIPQEGPVEFDIKWPEGLMIVGAITGQPDHVGEFLRGLISRAFETVSTATLNTQVMSANEPSVEGDYTPRLGKAPDDAEITRETVGVEAQEALITSILANEALQSPMGALPRLKKAVAGLPERPEGDLRRLTRAQAVEYLVKGGMTYQMIINIANGD